MTPDDRGSGSVRPAHVVNEAIRALFRRAGSGKLYGADRAAYEELVAEWVAATNSDGGRPEIVEAA
ncbi:hypothetical protein [Streptomyces sp. NPDC005799]|uniref:hypothetical protein n=1 Tax=Streptomyces sp. NPDC005799 TaxID=3154678 RepID=UPI00340FC9D7